jgi:general secretion pathway protein J
MNAFGGLKHFRPLWGLKTRQMRFHVFCSREGASAPLKNACGIYRQDGFTMIEALVGVALMGLILSLLATVTAQWIPNWRAGFARIQTADLAALALDRLTADLAAAEFISPIGQGRPLFYGSASEVTFVRLPLGPKPTTGPAPTGLEIIRFADSEKDGGLVRSRIPFSPESSVGVSTPDFEFSDASLLLRAPFKVSFGFAGPDRVWADDWTNSTTLPAAVRITVRNAYSDRILAVSTATLVHINAQAACASNTADSQCNDKSAPGSAPAPAPNPDQPAAGGRVL